jgi:proteic killer suppression protein
MHRRHEPARVGALSGESSGYLGSKVSRNWRVTFVFVGKDADAVDYEDYH